MKQLFRTNVTRESFKYSRGANSDSVIYTSGAHWSGQIITAGVWQLKFWHFIKSVALDSKVSCVLSPAETFFSREGKKVPTRWRAAHVWWVWACLGSSLKKESQVFTQHMAGCWPLC